MMTPDQQARCLDLISRAMAVRAAAAGPGHDEQGRVGSLERSVRGLRGEVQWLERRLSAHRTHKAGSAESILKHCLRRLGLSREWRRDELTDQERLALLDAIREYAKAWLRHEAEQFFGHYGAKIDGDANRTLSGDGGRIVGAELVRQSPDSLIAMRGGAEGASDGSTTDLDRWRGVHPGDDARHARDDAMVGPVSRALSAPLRHAVGRFFDRARNFIREAILAGAMALSGPEPLDAEDLAEVDRQHAAQIAFLDRFGAEVELRTPQELSEPSGAALANPMTAAEFIDRTSKYAGSVWVGAQAVNRLAVIRGGKAVQEARFHRLPNPEGHACAVCLGESQKGWVPVGSLLPVGDSTCLGIHCDCYFVYRMADGSIFITARGWKKAA